MTTAPGVEQRLRDNSRFQTLVRLPECPSTQDVAIEHPTPGSLAVWAEAQTRGRGRRGRTWYGRPGRDVEITFRIADLRVDNPSVLAPAIPTAIADAIERTAGIAIRFKWPNDLHHNGRKLCGILIDLVGNPVDSCAVGVGINVNRVEFPPELRDSATSLALVTGHETDRGDLVVALGEALERCLVDLESGELDRLQAMFKARLATTGQRVQLTGSDIDTEGRLADVDLFQVTLEDGRVFPLAKLTRLK